VLFRSLNGRGGLVDTTRFLNVTPCAVELGTESDGTRILDNHVVGPYQTQLARAVIVPANCVGVQVRTGFPANTTVPATVAPNNSGTDSIWYDVKLQGLRSAIGITTIADDAVGEFEFSTAGTWGIAAFGSNASASGAGRPFIVAFRVGDGSAYCTLLAGDAADITVGVGDPTGTTGTDARINVYASGTVNKLYIENRQGASANWMPAFLSLSNGEIVP